MQMGLSSNQAHIHHHGQAQTLTPSQPIYLRKHATLHQHAWVGLQLKPKSTAKHEHAQARYQHKLHHGPRHPSPSGQLPQARPPPAATWRRGKGWRLRGRRRDGGAAAARRSVTAAASRRAPRGRRPR